jgi:hypothetical protein
MRQPRFSRSGHPPVQYLLASFRLSLARYEMLLQSIQLVPSRWGGEMGANRRRVGRMCAAISASSDHATEEEQARQNDDLQRAEDVVAFQRDQRASE